MNELRSDALVFFSTPIKSKANCGQASLGRSFDLDGTAALETQVHRANVPGALTCIRQERADFAATKASWLISDRSGHLKPIEHLPAAARGFRGGAMLTGNARRPDAALTWEAETDSRQKRAPLL
jgi:hypothetical protein